MQLSQYAHKLVTEAYPDARIYLAPDSNTYTIMVEVSAADLIGKYRAAQQAQRDIERKFTPRFPRKRRLHWGKRH